MVIVCFWRKFGIWENSLVLEFSLKVPIWVILIVCFGENLVCWNVTSGGRFCDCLLGFGGFENGGKGNLGA